MRVSLTLRLTFVALLAAFMPMVAAAQFPGTTGRLFYLNQAGDLLSANPDGSSIKTLVAAATLNAITPPVANKTATKLAYANASGLAVANIDGTGITQLTNTANDKFPAWSPDGTKLYFDNSGDILSVNADGTGRTTVIAHSGTLTYTNAIVSPDGLSLGILGFDSGTNIINLYHVAASGGSATNLTNNASGTNTLAADYSPDGTKFALATTDASNSHLATMAVGGGAQTNLLTVANASNKAYTYPTWSPSGTQLAVLRIDTGLGGGFYPHGMVVTLNADGSGAADVTALSGASPISWSVLGLIAAVSLPNTSTTAHVPWLFLIFGVLLVGAIEGGRRLHLRRYSA